MNIKFYRKQKHITQQTLADDTGIDRALLARYENGSRKPPIENIILLAKYFNVSVDCLLGVDTPDVQQSPQLQPQQPGAELINAGYYELSPDHRKAVDALIHTLAAADRAGEK